MSMSALTNAASPGAIGTTGFHPTKILLKRPLIATGPNSMAAVVRSYTPGVTSTSVVAGPVTSSVLVVPIMERESANILPPTVIVFAVVSKIVSSTLACHSK